VTNSITGRDLLRLQRTVDGRASDQQSTGRVMKIEVSQLAQQLGINPSVVDLSL
jgi:hypothetical protein